MAALRLLDAHALIRSDDPARYPFQPLGAALEPREIEHGLNTTQLLEALDRSRVERAVLVQRARLYGFDNRYVCDSAVALPERLACVCQLNARDPQCAQQARELVRKSGAVGLRFMEPVKGDGLDWLDSHGARLVWRVACEEGVPVSLHFFPWNRRAGLEVLRARLTELAPRALVLDSLAGTAVDAGAPDYGTDELLERVMEFAGARVKFTAMILARLVAAKRSAEGLLAHLVQRFGASRVLWGSDVLAPGQSYESAVRLVLEASTGLGTAEREQVLYGTAAALYPTRQPGPGAPASLPLR